jgi:methyl-accepting chemotaxis protein
MRSTPHSSPRRTFRLAQPGQQARLAVAILAITFVFGMLMVGNSYAAYKSLVDVALSTAPAPLGEDIQEQTRHYIRVTSTLATAYALAVLALSMVFVRKMIGPVVAIERHARALKSGDYSSRIGMRTGRSIYSALALQLNDLATRLDHEASETELRGHERPWAA